MKQFIRLLHFELKKIRKRKSTWITLGVLIITHLFMESFYYMGSSYVDGEFLETHLEGIKTDMEYGLRLSGRKIDDALLQEMQTAYGKYADKEDTAYILTEDYQQTVRPYNLLYHTLHTMLWEYDINILTATAQEFYEARTAGMADKWEAYKLTSAEKAYWQSKEDLLKKPFTYQYAESYDYLISMSGLYRACMLVTFFIAICISAVFTEEHGRKTDQLILCSRFGRKQLYFAKILAGSLYAVCASGILLLCTALPAFFIYGTDGFWASIQLQAGDYPALLTSGQVFLIMVGILFLSSVLVSVFTMVFSEITNSSIAAMAVVTAAMFAARLIAIPAQYRVFSQAWNYFPINLLKFDAGFCDMRLVLFLGMKFTSWEFSFILYAVLTFLLIIAGKKVYCRYQVEGR